MSNTVGLVPGSVAGVYGFRRELTGQWKAVGTMAVFSALGGGVGGLLLLTLPDEAFAVVVPYLLVLAALLSAIQPRVARFVRRRAPEGRRTDTRPVTFGLVLGVLGTGIYGGYFGAAQGVILLALLGILWSTDMHRANGAKNVLAGIANLVSSIIFISSGTVDWMIVLVIGAGSFLGGVIGAHVGRTLSAAVLRTILVLMAVISAVVLFAT